ASDGWVVAHLPGRPQPRAATSGQPRARGRSAQARAGQARRCGGAGQAARSRLGTGSHRALAGWTRTRVETEPRCRAREGGGRLRCARHAGAARGVARLVARLELLSGAWPSATLGEMADTSRLKDL